MIKNLLLALLLAHPAFAAQQKTTLPVTINLLTPTAAGTGAVPTLTLGPTAADRSGLKTPIAANAAGHFAPAIKQAAAAKGAAHQVPVLAGSSIPNAKPYVPGAVAASAEGKNKPAASAIGQAGIAASAKDGGSFDGSKPGTPASDIFASATGDPKTAFNLAYPGNRSERLLTAVGARFEDLALDLVMKQVFLPDVAGMNAAEDMIHPHHPLRGELLDFSEKVIALANRDDAVGRGFAADLGKLAALKDRASNRIGGDGWRLPPQSFQGGETWDLAAGPNAAQLMVTPQDGKTKLVFFDRSAFVVAYLEHGRRLIEAALKKPMSHVEVRQADLNTMSKPAHAPKVIRWKNVHTYVDGFESRFEEMAGWLQPGGSMLVQNDSGWGQRVGIIQKLGPKIQSLIKQGYVFDYEPLGQGGLETLTLTKPAAGADAVAQKQASVKSMKRWGDYVAEVGRVNDEERRNPFFMFFR